MAGTGGTSSSSSPPEGFWKLRDFGAGRRELGFWGMLRGWREPVEVRTVLKLLVELMDRPEL